MAVYYKVYQSNRKNNPNRGKWYARAAMVGTDSTDELAASIEEKCTVHKADVVAVIEALIGEMTRSLQNSRRVKLPGFGTFKLGIASKPADERDKFSLRNIKNVHVVFIPELKKTAGVSTRTFVNGARLKNFSDFEVNLNIKPDEGSGSGSGSGTGTGTGAGSGGSGTGGTGGTDA